MKLKEFILSRKTIQMRHAVRTFKCLRIGSRRNWIFNFVLTLLLFVGSFSVVIVVVAFRF